MSKELSNPLTGLTSSIPLDIENPTDAELARLRSGMLELLDGLQAKPAGTARGRIHDPDWSKDISQLVARIKPHEIIVLADSGLFVTETVSTKIDTVRMEIDSQGEICAWLYEES